MKEALVKRPQSIFSRVRTAVADRSEERRKRALLERGAELFVKQHGETMKMLAQETEHPS